MASRKKTTKRVAVRKSAPVESSKEVLDTKSKPRQFLSRRKVLIGFLIVLAIVFVYYFKGLFVAALVNGQPITRLDVIQELEKRGGQQTLSSLITQALILQEARKQGVDVTKTEVDDEVKKVEDNLKKQGQNLDDALVSQGLTREDFTKQIRIQKLVEKMLSKDIKATDKEINDYIDKNNASIPDDMNPEEVTASARQQLEQQKLSAKAQEWLADLQSKAKIQHFVNY